MRLFGKLLSWLRTQAPGVLAVLLAAHLSLVHAAESAESDRAFLAAIGSFEVGFWERANNEFGEFLKNFPDSSKVARAVLLQAQCRFMLKDYASVASLLAANLAKAGDLADQFLYWQGEAQFYQDYYAKAAMFYEELLESHPKSPLRLEASYGRAWAAYKLNQADRAIELLTDPAGGFQTASQTSTNEIKIVEGNLLLADVLLTRKRFREAEAVLEELGKRALRPEQNFDRLYLLASSTFADLRTDEALSRVTNLVAYTISPAGRPVWYANALMLKAEIFRGREPAAAIGIYEEIARIAGVPKNQTRQAVMKMVQVIQEQNQLTNAVQRLDGFLRETLADTNSPPFVATDLIRLTLGELYLKQFRDLRGPAAAGQPSLQVTNLLQLAKAQFDVIANSLTNSPLLGKAHLDRGWCFWEEGLLTGQPEMWDQGKAAFATAVERLAVSKDQAVARLKLGDCEFQTGDYTNAVNSYHFLIENYGHLPEVKSTLFDLALNQTVRASMEMGDFETARDALGKTLAWFPTNTWSERSLILFAQEMLKHGEPDAAREAVADFEKRFPESGSIPEMRLVRAESFAAAENWPEAIQEYERWVGGYTNHALLAQAQFDRARAYDRAGQGTNALALFAGYLTNHAESSLAPLARYWVATYHFNQRDYVRAEQHYQTLGSTSQPGVELGYRARLMAGQSALLRQKPSDARPYLTNLVVDPVCPDSVKAEALFVLGEVELMDASQPAPNNPLGRFQKAIGWFSLILEDYPSSRLVPQAYGKLGNCHRQLGQWSKAIDAYLRVTDSTEADVGSRCQAEVAIGEVLELQAARVEDVEEKNRLLSNALDHYLNVVFEKRLRPSERTDPLWLAEAGLPAGDLARRLGKEAQAIRIYEQLRRDLSSRADLQAALDRRLAALRVSSAKAQSSD
jgi:TolA-binding protein